MLIVQNAWPTSALLRRRYLHLSPPVVISAANCSTAERTATCFWKSWSRYDSCYRFVVVGDVVMPEHVHLLLGEPERGDRSVVIQALKQSFARRLLRKLRSQSDPRQSSLWGAPLETSIVLKPITSIPSSNRLISIVVAHKSNFS